MGCKRVSLLITRPVLILKMNKLIDLSCAGKNVVVALCAGNIDTRTFARCLERGLATNNRLCRFVVRVTDRPGEGPGSRQDSDLMVWSREIHS